MIGDSRGHQRRGGRGRGLALLVTGAAILAAGCGSARDSTDAASQASGESTVAIREARVQRDEPQLPAESVGADGRSVTVEDLDRIVALSGNISEVIWALGLGDNVVGRDISTTIEEAEDVTLVTRAHDVSAEAVLSLNPTVVVADTDTGPPEALEQIRNVGVPVVVVEVPTEVAGIAERIAAVGDALGMADTAREVAASTTAAIDRVVAGTSGGERSEQDPVVAFLYMRGQAGVYLMGGDGSGADSMIEAAGGVDAGSAIGLDQAFTPITSEALVEAAPDIILMTTTGLEPVGGIDGLLGIPGIAQTPAGMERRVVTIEDGLLYGFGTRTPEALERLAEGFATAGSASTGSATVGSPGDATDGGR